tara:strand:- start:41813 stop:42982 length:1170 start_codon:yes stop_codon:yes gene_type:complete
MQPKIAIVGAGIAGLSAALACARLGFQTDIFEQSASLTEVGAGLQLSPNATRLLDELGVLQRLGNKWYEPDALSLASGKDMQTLCNIPIGPQARQRWGAPYVVVHRADLLGALNEAVGQETTCRLHLGKTISATTQNELTQHLKEISGSAPDLIVAADGVWSRTRQMQQGASAATFSGSIAWRALLHHKDFPALEAPENVNLFLGPDTHLVTYPLGQRGMMNAVAVTPGGAGTRAWDNSGDSDILARHFRHWNPQITSVLAATSWRCWPLFEVRKNAWQAANRTVLIGDAAHAMTPHAAQGAAMAIEDACTLAACLQRSNGEISPALDAFVSIRDPRINKIRKRGDFNKFAYQTKGPIRMARDLVLSLRSPAGLAADMDWIYKYRLDKP